MKVRKILLIAIVFVVLSAVSLLLTKTIRFNKTGISADINIGKNIEKTGKIGFDNIKGGSVLYEVFLADDGEKYWLSWEGYKDKNGSHDLRNISTRLSYLPPFGDLKIKITGYKTDEKIDLSKNGELTNFVMTDFQILNKITTLDSKNVYVCLEKNDLKTFYLYKQDEERSGSMGPAEFNMEFPKGEKVRLINLFKELIKINDNCKNSNNGCDREPKICDAAKINNTIPRCSNLFLECSPGTSSAIRLSAFGEGYFSENSINPQFRIKSYNIDDLTGAYSDSVKSFKNSKNY